MSHGIGSAHQQQVFRSLISHTLTSRLTPDPGLLQQTIWLNLLPLYFNPLNGHHIATTAYNVPILGQCIAHVDVHSHRSYNGIQQPEPSSHLHLRVICAPDPLTTGLADDALIDAFLRTEGLNNGGQVSLRPWEKPVIVISRVDADGQMFARPVEWQGDIIYLTSRLQRVNLCTNGGQTDFHRKLVDWADEGELVKRDDRNDGGGDRNDGESDENDGGGDGNDGESDKNDGGGDGNDGESDENDGGGDGNDGESDENDGGGDGNDRGSDENDGGDDEEGDEAEVEDDSQHLEEEDGSSSHGEGQRDT